MNMTDTAVCKYCGAPLEKANMKQNFQSYENDLPLDTILLTIFGVTLFGIVLSLILLAI